MGKSGSPILGRYAGGGYPLPKSFDLCGTQYNFFVCPVQTINRLTIKRPSSNFVESYLIRPFPVHMLSESKNYCLVQTGKDFAKPGRPCGYL